MGIKQDQKDRKELAYEICVKVSEVTDEMLVQFRKDKAIHESWMKKLAKRDI